MRIGIGLPFVGPDGIVHNVQALGARAKMVEDLGFNSAWMGDASFRRMSTWPDPLLWLLAAARATEHIEVGTAVYQVPLRNPVIAAQRLLAFEALAPGRLLFGVGPGSTEKAFDAVGGSFEGRWKTFHASVRTMRELSDGKAVGDADFAPPAEIQGGPRFLLGAWYGGKNLQRAATEYDGWLSSAKWTKVGNMEDAIKRYRDLGGTRAMIATCGIDLRAPGGKLGDEDSFGLACPPAEAADRLAWASELGYDDIILHVRDGVHGVFDSDLLYDVLAEIRDVLQPDATPVATA
jgi:alkanesulfonate monooxygenase SsuD/methylene tetrahydromethanopterin reductase-like flavin-dependent oxidoreductase (luciferase family)